MKDKICDLQKCTGCSCCKNLCPVNAISMVTNKEGFEIPIIDKDRCISCGLCSRKCPVNDRTDTYFNKNLHSAYAGKSNDIERQLLCTSGGIFTSIALEFIQKGGIVYGAAYDEEFRVTHIRVDCIDDVVKLSDSKYSQSIIGDTYKFVKRDINSGKRVLFSGTSCQISGLYHYLDEKPERLYCIDVICHGVPSPGVWKWYIDKCREKYKKNIVSVRHRGKNPGGWNWKKQFFELRFEDGKGIKENIWENSYISGFLNDLYLRPSCHMCQYKNKQIKRVADITLADFWGCEDVEKEFYDTNGVSLIIVNNDKGNKLLHETKNISTKETNINEALKYNVAAFRPYPFNKGRKFFFENFTKELSLDSFQMIIKEGIRLKNKYNALKNINIKMKSIIKTILIKSGVYNK